MPLVGSGAVCLEQEAHTPRKQNLQKCFFMEPIREKDLLQTMQDLSFLWAFGSSPVGILMVWRITEERIPDSESPEL